MFMDNIILYSTNCPKCKVLEKKLVQKNIQYTKIENLDILREKGFTFLPVLEVGSSTLNFKEAVDYINKIGGNTNE